MISSPSFSQKMKAGATPADLKKHFSMTENEFNRIISCLQQIKKGVKL